MNWSKQYGGPMEDLKITQSETKMNEQINEKTNNQLSEKLNEQLSESQYNSGEFMTSGNVGIAERATENGLAVFLKDKRIVAGLSQKDVALKLGYSTSQFISNWERGISQPPLATLRKIAELYKVSADEMFNVLLRSTISQVEIDLKKKFYTKEASGSN